MQAGIPLLPSEVARLERNLDRIDRCGTVWYRYWRVRSDGSKAWEEQLLAPRQCGQRGCIHCGEKARKHHAKRVLGEWSTAMLLTLPQGGLTEGEAWRQIHGHLARFLRKLRDALKGGCWAVRGSDKLTYSWALERHESGYPHVHLVTNLRWIGWQWMRTTWGQTIGFKSPFVSVQKVRDTSDACGYLAKYVAKSRMPVDLLAVLYRKRLWASTTRKLPRTDPQWIELERVSEREAQEELDARDDGDDSGGWRVLWRTAQGGAKMIRDDRQWCRPDEERSEAAFADLADSIREDRCQANWTS